MIRSILASFALVFAALPVAAVGVSGDAVQERMSQDIAAGKPLVAHVCRVSERKPADVNSGAYRIEIVRLGNNTDVSRFLRGISGRDDNLCLQV
jgi:hypothetical protein